MSIAPSQPTTKPRNPCFSSGPCAKRPDWSLDALRDAAIGRSHRSSLGKKKLHEVITLSREILRIPDDYVIGIVPASDTGAYEMAMWTMLGARGVEMFAWESFGEGWISDAVKQLKLKDCTTTIAPYGTLPDLSTINWDHDVCFTWNGTTSGVCVPNGDWIADHRAGLTFCDATSAVFAMDVPFEKLDVTTWSWQKVLGGEGAHGMIVLSPRAVARLESYTPAWPLPKIFRLTKGGKLIDGIFKGETINTPSMLCVEDALDGLRWAKDIGGLDALIARSHTNLATINAWVERTSWVDFLAHNPEHRSNTSICLSIVDSWFTALPQNAQYDVTKQIASTLEKAGVAYDINGYRDAPAGLRIWGGATVETSDIEALLPWLDFAFANVKHEAQNKAA
ncbi:MAG: phosphoserine transaminase [Alphaproteobacteria bacterium]|nr:MAG: phosphoserine transaminase [Alphaproteobacteria bacterium]TAF16015.1 MAG: phosphoserine transaminase [Alphaproteobacteria bacterium]TAF76212.1 MAG: phosphoserine transaminase [Alphaproteobacteria bacterium]